MCLVGQSNAASRTTSAMRIGREEGHQLPRDTQMALQECLIHRWLWATLGHLRYTCSHILKPLHLSCQKAINTRHSHI
ncbi:hypothetical protein E2C01_028365 [Portunus trituberculatus]|uniref:Uncharacterized protein n=1 Tax=Portunus trituberculatus TaxID=210409 RepID=A0A5B7EKF7_PORTR|nr:hypothetical protein [Portunus trituberculatus]